MNALQQRQWEHLAVWNTSKHLCLQMLDEWVCCSAQYIPKCNILARFSLRNGTVLLLTVSIHNSFFIMRQKNKAKCHYGEQMDNWLLISLYDYQTLPTHSLLLNMFDFNKPYEVWCHTPSRKLKCWDNVIRANITYIVFHCWPYIKMSKMCVDISEWIYSFVLYSTF